MKRILILVVSLLFVFSCSREHIDYPRVAFINNMPFCIKYVDDTDYNNRIIWPGDTESFMYAVNSPYIVRFIKCDSISPGWGATFSFTTGDWGWRKTFYINK